ncbi:hypothetical protein Pla175_49880 [Pirellulimonas nuda]|uniref:Uncharacterized protein n=1 Tax=Pirellulimonas nuda TaxID=2528009 RepID=A0A518DJ99_9BACT|nr:hypothetical protein [Pirellulimonas nuda]QDU91559.1 hypothetical protein Pla175_49880 [Pirellulimonas nuda]
MTDTALNPVAPLGREEYIEQAQFFATLASRLTDNAPTQEILSGAREEALATTKLPMAIDFLLSELRHAGVLASAMARLPHYFTAFQTYIVSEGEKERGNFDFRLGLEVLQLEAKYRSESPTQQGVFLYQFEVLCRNRLGYDRGLEAVAADPGFDPPWRKWIDALRRKIGMVDIADLIYVHSEHYRRRNPSDILTQAILFGDREGRIALANRKKDPLLLFSSLHRQLDYPSPPRPMAQRDDEDLLPSLSRRIEYLEKRLKIVEDEQRGGFDLSKFYQKPDRP